MKVQEVSPVTVVLVTATSNVLGVKVADTLLHILYQTAQPQDFDTSTCQILAQDLVTYAVGVVILVVANAAALVRCLVVGVGVQVSFDQCVVRKRGS